MNLTASSAPLTNRLRDTAIAAVRTKAVEPDELAALLVEAADELEEHEQSFDLRWDADIRAIRRWQEATGRRLIWPDHADLCIWLLEQLEARHGH